MTPRRPHGDDGTILPLMLAYVVLSLLLVMVVTDVSAYFLARRSLQAVADGAALAGAQGVSSSVYAGPGAAHGPALPLADAACTAATTYLQDNDAVGTHPGSAYDVSVGGQPCDSGPAGPGGPAGAAGATVSVVARQQVRLPMYGAVRLLLPPAYANGVPLTVRADADLRCAGC